LESEFVDCTFDGVENSGRGGPFSITGGGRTVSVLNCRFLSCRVTTSGYGATFQISGSSESKTSATIFLTSFSKCTALLEGQAFYGWYCNNRFNCSSVDLCRPSAVGRVSYIFVSENCQSDSVNVSNCLTDDFSGDLHQSQPNDSIKKRTELTASIKIAFLFRRFKRTFGRWNERRRQRQRPPVLRRQRYFGDELRFQRKQRSIRVQEGGSVIAFTNSVFDSPPSIENILSSCRLSIQNPTTLTFEIRRSTIFHTEPLRKRMFVRPIWRAF
jgi:hypothetical protein